MYFYHDGENEVGPFSIDKLHGLMQTRMIGERTLVRLSDGEIWVPLGKLLSDLTPISEKQPSKSVEIAQENFDISEKASTGTQSYSKETGTPPHSQITKIASDAKSKNLEAVDVPSGWIASPPTPWRRYAARLLDTTLNGTIVFFLIAIALYAIAPATADAFFLFFESGGVILDIMITVVAASLLGGSLIGVSGFTLGKFIYGVKVTRTDGKKLGLLAGLSRDFSVLSNGLALGIPIVSLFTMWNSYKGLKENQSVSWDEGKYIVWHRPSGVAQYILNIIGIVLTFIVLASVRAMGEM